MTLRDAAHRYAERGLPVFPCVPGRKVPLTTHGCLDATCDPDQIEKWWKRWPAANLGLATGRASGVVVVDYDRKHGKPGLKTRDSIHLQFQINTLTATTATLGIHEVFRYPGPVLRNSVDRLPGVDFRTDGGYIVVAPSIVHGVPYEWIRRVPPAVLPAELIAMLQPPPMVEPHPHREYSHCGNRDDLIHRVRKYLEHTPPAIEGRGGDLHTFQVACRIVRGFGLSDSEGLELLNEWNRYCQPPWSERDLLIKISSARKSGIEAIGARLKAR